MIHILVAFRFESDQTLTGSVERGESLRENTGRRRRRGEMLDNLAMMAGWRFGFGREILAVSGPAKPVRSCGVRNGVTCASASPRQSEGER